MVLPVPQTSWPWLYAGLAFYLLVVRALRHSRVQALERERANISKLSPARAQKMIKVPLTLDLPFMTTKAQAFALFKTYGIVRNTIGAVFLHFLSDINAAYHFEPIASDKAAWQERKQQ
jgi:hypothetical protein